MAGLSRTHGSITRATGLSPATAHRILAELVDWGAVERTGRGRYRIGLHLWRLGSLAPQGRELRDMALPYLQDLLEVTREVVHLVVLDENQALYVEKLESRPECWWSPRSAVACRCTPPGPERCCSPMRRPGSSTR